MRTHEPARRRGFTLVELLVTMAVIVVLVALFGGAISAARNGSRANTTQNAITRLDQIVTEHFRRYESRSVSPAILADVRQSLGAGGTNPSAARAWHVRRAMITADMPDRWSDVSFMATTGTSEGFPRSAAQAAYVATWKAANPKPTDQYGGAECLFMIVMQGGFADCLDCNGLASLKKGDKDGDGALEFWDDWNNPIDYILWAPGFQKSGETTPFFNNPAEQRTLDAAFPATGSVRPGLGMQPLIYSAGPDGEYGLERNGEKATLSRGSSPPGRDCGNPAEADAGTSGAPASGSGSRRDDNIVNVEIKAS